MCVCGELGLAWSQIGRLGMWSRVQYLKWSAKSRMEHNLSISINTLNYIVIHALNKVIHKMWGNGFDTSQEEVISMH